jgi:hypothetical protein
VVLSDLKENAMHVKSVLLVLTLLALPCDGAMADRFSTEGKCSITGTLTINGKRTGFPYSYRPASLAYCSLYPASPSRQPYIDVQELCFSKHITRAGGKVSGQVTVAYMEAYISYSSLYKSFNCTFSGRVYPEGKQLKATITFSGKTTDGSKDTIKGTVTFAGPKPK